MKDFMFYTTIVYGVFHLFCADAPFKTSEEIKRKCALIACACFLFALGVK